MNALITFAQSCENYVLFYLSYAPGAIASAIIFYAILFGPILFWTTIGLSTWRLVSRWATGTMSQALVPMLNVAGVLLGIIVVTLVWGHDAILWPYSLGANWVDPTVAFGTSAWWQTLLAGWITTNLLGLHAAVLWWLARKPDLRAFVQ